MMQPVSMIFDMVLVYRLPLKILNQFNPGVAYIDETNLDGIGSGLFMVMHEPKVMRATYIVAHCISAAEYNRFPGFFPYFQL